MGSFTNFVNTVHNIIEVTGNYTLSDDDYTLIAKNDALDILITIPEANLMIGREIIVKRGKNSVGQVNIVPDAGEIEDLGGYHVTQTTLSAVGQYGSCQKFQASPCGCWLLISS